MIIRRILNNPVTSTLATLFVLCAVIGIVNVNFFAIANLIDIFRTVSYTFIIAAPLTCLMIAGGLDLSIGAVTALGGVVCGWCLVAGIPVWLSIIFAMLAGGFIGVLNGLISVKAKIFPLIVTLGMQFVVFGFVLVATKGLAVTGFVESFKVLGQGKIFGTIYTTIIVAVFIGVIFHILLARTKIGRAIYAVGGNQETAKLAGINVSKIRFSLYIIVSVFAALCGVFMASRFNSAQTGAGAGTELIIMASVIIGGTSLFGGEGSILGTFIGCLLLAVINNGLILMHVSNFALNLIFGFILIISLFMDKYRRSKSSSGY